MGDKSLELMMGGYGTAVMGLMLFKSEGACVRRCVVNISFNSLPENF